MTLLRSFTAVLLLFQSLSLCGQSAFGFSAGLSQYEYYLPGQQNDPSLGINNNSKVGFQAGVHYDWFLGPRFFTNIQAQWRYYSSEISAGGSGILGGGSRKGDFTFNTADLSVVPAVLFGNAVYLWLGAGAFAQANLLDPEIDITERTWLLQPQTTTEEVFSMRQSALFRNTQAGLLGVLGLRLHFLGKTQLLIRFTYRYGLTEVSTRELHQFPAKQNSFGLDLGLNFYRFREITYRPHF